MFNLSVFKTWEKDSDSLIKQALDHDVNYWKVQRLTKDTEATNQIVEIIRENWSKLNEIWLTLCAVGSFPVMTLTEFTSFCKQIEIFDSNFKVQHVERLFMQANVELED
jgi:hypothetical protein